MGDLYKAFISKDHSEIAICKNGQYYIFDTWVVVGMINQTKEEFALDIVKIDKEAGFLLMCEPTDKDESDLSKNFVEYQF